VPEVVPVVSRAELGAYGEQLAAEHYAARGAVVLARNWRCREGELDLVVQEPDGTLVFCEVKTRSGIGFGDPAEAVDRRKARRLRLLACRWLVDHRPARSGDLRFDVVAIVRRPGTEPELVHLPAAF
jgi:putative endonuclease